MRSLLALVALLCVVAGCGSGDREPTPDELTGLIVAIDGEGSDVEAFTLEAGLEEYEILIADDVDYGFDLEHLKEHQETGDRVRCELEQRDGRLYARAIFDA